MVDQKILEKFVSELKPETKESNKTYSAIVSKIDKEGTVWVRVAGSDKDTPTALVGTEVKKGDAVNVEWRNNKLYIASNYSNPAAGVGRVQAVEIAAEVANTAANNAVADAVRAKEAADDAKATADSVHGIAIEAKQDAEDAEAAAGEARQSAENASEYAARALGNLSTVQSVTETLNWITAHGTMTITTDTALDPTHVYFVRDNNGDYEVGNYHYSVVTEPKLEDISTYYVLSIDESLNNYVGTHLALTGEGLWILPDGMDAQSHRVLIATGGQGHIYESAGTYIIDSAGKTVAKLGEVITLGKADGSRSYLKLDYRSMQMIDNDARAYLHISNLIDSDGNVCEEFNGTGRARDREFTVSFDVTDVASVKVNGVSTQDYTRNGKTFTFTRAWPLGPSETLAIKYKTTVQTTWYAKAYSLGFRKGSSAVGVSSFVLGLIAAARGFASFAEGYSTEANADYSHAQNIGTIASSDNQTALGSYNIEDDEDNYALIIGNGTSNNARSNALTVDWLGEVQLYLDVDSSASKTTAATSGEDKDLFNAIRDLGWYDDVII